MPKSIAFGKLGWEGWWKVLGKRGKSEEEFWEKRGGRRGGEGDVRRWRRLRLVAVGTPKVHLRITDVATNYRLWKSRPAKGRWGTLSACVAFYRHTFRRSFRPTATERRRFQRHAACLDDWSSPSSSCRTFSAAPSLLLYIRYAREAPVGSSVAQLTQQFVKNLSENFADWKNMCTFVAEIVTK